MHALTLRLDHLRDSIIGSRATMAGYPLNLAAPDLSELAWFRTVLLNNLGDPFVGGTLGINTFEYERDVVLRFASLYHLPAHEAWGYVTTGGSEGNRRGLTFGRRQFPNATVYVSDAAHYKVFDDLIDLQAPAMRVRTDPTGRIDLTDFRRVLVSGAPAIVLLTAGTAMTGAMDNISGVCQTLTEWGCPHYIHVDAALFGGILPFERDAPPWDFRLPISSLSVSGHKMLGMVDPCGVFVSRKSARTGSDVEYVGSTDTTIGGSRSGFNPLALWYTLERYGWEWLAERSRRCLEVADMLADRLHEAGWGGWRHMWSPIVCFDRPSPEVCVKWQLAAEGNMAHVVCMPHMGEEMMELLIRDLQTAKAA